MITELRDSVYTKLTVIKTTYFEEAPNDANVEMGYLTFSRPTGANSYDSVKTYPEDMIQISGYCKTLLTLETMEASVRAAFDRQQLTFSLASFNVTDITCTFENQGKSTQTGVYWFTHQYRFNLDPK